MLYSLTPFCNGPLHYIFWNPSQTIYVLVLKEVLAKVSQYIEQISASDFMER